MIDVHKIIPFKQWHLKQLQTCIEGGIGFISSERYLQAIDQSAYSRTWINKGKVLCIGGIVEFWPGVGEAWVIFADEARKEPKQLVRTVRTYLNQHKPAFHRLQALVKDAVPCSQRFVEMLGFVREATLPQYGPDKSDFIMYSKVN